MSGEYKVKGDVSMVRQPGYPVVTEEEDSVTVRDCYVCAASKLDSFPAVGSLWRGYLPRNSGVDRVALRRVERHPMSSDGLWLVTLTYEPEPLYDRVDGDIRTTYELATDDMDVPLEQHPSYRACWNHTLLGKAGETVPAWWATARNTEGTGETYQWMKPGDPVPEGWTVLKAPAKPGVEAFRSGVPKVTVTKTSPKRAPLQQEARRQDYTRGAPGVTFGYSGSWLRGGSSIRREGRRWVLTVVYMNSAVVDTDIYDS